MESEPRLIDKYESYIDRLADVFEPALLEELKLLPTAEMKANQLIAKVTDKVDFLPLLIKGSMRIVRYDIYGNEVLIYNINELESCIISITSVYVPGLTSGDSIANEDLVALKIPLEKVIEWTSKYKSWVEFTYKLNEKRMQELIRRNREVSEKNKEIRDSISYAKRIQNAALPARQTISELLPESFVLFKPRDIVSGDYYWVTQVHSRTVVVVADCTGHGVPGAFMSMLGISLLNKLFKDEQELKASKVLDLLRDDVIHSLRQDDQLKYTGESGSELSSVKDGMDMAVMIFDFDHFSMQYAGAYNPFYLVRKNNLHHFKGDRMPVGFHIQESSCFTNQEIALEKGDMIYAFSDGYADQIDATGTKKFMTRNFKELLLQINHLPMEDQKKELDDNIEQWRGDHDQIDDILVVGIRV